eukprot:575146-Pyramimonas_sp.AAC.1
MVDCAVSDMFCGSGPLESFCGQSTHASSDARRAKFFVHRFSPHTLQCAWPCPGCQTRQMQRERPLTMVTAALPTMRTASAGCERK